MIQLKRTVGNPAYRLIHFAKIVKRAPLENDVVEKKQDNTHEYEYIFSLNP